VGAPATLGPVVTSHLTGSGVVAAVGGTRGQDPGGCHCWRRRRERRWALPTRVVVVTNLGASNVKANDAIARCLASDLPDAVKALVQLCPPPAASSPSAAGMGHRLVLLTQPLRHTVLEGRVSPAHAAKVRQSHDN